MPETLPAYEGLTSSGESLNILIAGKHGSNVDTIIFANINPSTEKATLISIPRDLYYNGRKINSIYGLYGMYEFVNQLEEITGREIDKYILVDMYVFADVIDEMDGIDITLEEDLIDPTYSTYDNGVWSTLYYPAGDYHLNGTQTLRVARSRHYSSDYDRAERQQLILEAIKEKALSMSISDANSLYNIFTLLLDNTETDIRLDEAITYYLKYKNYDISRGNVLNPTNVLNSEKEIVEYETSETTEVCDDNGENCEEKYFIYTLSPHEGNWDYVKWYFDEQL